MMRYLWSFVPFLILAGIIQAGEKARPNSLTEKEIADGWILLFDGETTFGWEIDGEAKVEKGYLVLGGKKETKAKFSTPFYLYNVALEFERTGKMPPKGFHGLIGESHSKLGGSKTLKLTGTRKLPEGAKIPTIGFQVTGGEEGIGVGSDGNPNPSEEEIKKWNVPEYFEITVPAGTRLHLRNFKVQPIQTQSLFNGKNLDGWKVLPGYKSKYSVTEEGWLNVKDGRGDIQTTDTFKDFLLQLDCISNGEHLNSGIFFRCIPNQYQQGYEAQIRNQFTPGETRVYKLDKYDPKTHKKIGTYQVKSTAIDFGTGGIYRRMPARKGASEDKEWFTMTVVAHGNHLATWVNGVQVVDWMDHRPLNDNARRGCCLNAGAISIQGHDPTTDLSFKNFRISEYPSYEK